MEAALNQQSEKPLTASQLLAPLHDAMKPRARHRVGTEAEKFGVRIADGRPLPFEGPDGVQRFLLELRDRHGWHEYREHESGPVIALQRGAANITLEPGGQLELSGAPLDTIHETCAEFRGHMAELRDISGELGVAWLGLGFHPLATQAQLPWIPKLRYGVMKDYLPTRGPRAHDMMRRTATVQANFDYTSEADAVRKMRVALALSPVISAMFANAPFYEGQATGDRSHRIAVWLGMDPDRSGLLPFAWEEDFGFQRYVEWALDVPMFMVQRGSEVVYNTGQTFRAFMAEGYGGTAATYDDWVTHLNTLFPEVRLKKTIEVRGADSQRTEMICALPALTKGFFYDERALAEAESLVSGLDHATVEGSRAGIARDGLSADFAGRPVQRWAEELLDIAAGGLARIGALDRHGNDERVHLKGIRALVEKGMTPADALVAKIAKEQPLLPQLLEHARL